jgi:hypothetical protein
MDTSNNLSVLRFFDTSNDSTATEALGLLSLPFITPPAFDTRIKRHPSPLLYMDSSIVLEGHFAFGTWYSKGPTHAPWTDFQQASGDWAPCRRVVSVCVLSFLTQLLSWWSMGPLSCFDCTLHCVYLDHRFWVDGFVGLVQRSCYRPWQGLGPWAHLRLLEMLVWAGNDLRLDQPSAVTWEVPLRVSNRERGSIGVCKCPSSW